MHALSVGPLIFGFLIAVLAGCDHLQTDKEVIPQSWQPSLTTLREFLESDQVNQTAVNQRRLNDQSQHLADILDAQLFIVYVQLLQTLDGQNRDALFEEQRRWLTDRETASKNAVVSKEGSLATLEYNGAFIKMTQDRLAELNGRFHSVP
ncbi:MAG: lysozyme inhibitor LprI family protein [Methylicorpusculum sp.]|uniref:lysozyme inhibitor LprI family protein n=1 Tax=Methylicorpusculum sp. TaxID=2713644 RepID=UPI002718EFCF|nr:lysozyme inhibitor LprI family protein [Methylicorpusculum sp.]MDO8938038.1 lysozyme inhibitor LprI family protein [Methylicorpusculum sp.]MDP2201018.1 lysozyme inhibitor LprI family protein [Methylicorpusculum sp.]